MTHYIEFTSEDGGRLLVEVEEEEVAPPPGVIKAGLLDRRRAASVASAQATFEEAVRTAVHRNVLAVSEALVRLPRAPSEVELTFGLKATGEIGNIAIAKIGGEANLTLRLHWKAENDRAA